MMWEYDTMDSQTKCLDGNMYAQVFSNETFFDDIYTMARKSDSGIVLRKSITELEVPKHLTINGSIEQNPPVTEFINILRRNNT